MFPQYDSQGDALTDLFGFPQDRYTPEPAIQVMAGGNIYIRRMHFPQAGCTERGHSHAYDHITFLERGRIGVEVAGRQAAYEGPTAIKIVAGEIHTLVALTDDTVAYCLHALRNPESEEVMPFGHCPFELDPMASAAPLTRAPSRNAHPTHVLPHL